MVWSTSVASIPARSTAAFDAWTARSTGENALSLPPNVPNGVRTADRNTIPSPFFIVSPVPRSARALAAAHAEFPGRIELRPAAGAVLRREILAAVRAVGDRASFGKRPAAISAALRDLHARERRHGERSRSLGSRTIPGAACGRDALADGVPARVLGRDRNAKILHRFRNE